MDIALVKNSQDHIHHEDCRKQEQREGLKQLSKHQRLTLEGSLHGWVMWLNLCHCIFNVLRSISYSGIRQKIEIKRDAGELVEMIHSLRANDFLGGGYHPKRNQIGHVT